MGKRPAFLYGRARCIFCERQPPEIKISKEHIFGDWLRELFPRTSATTHTYGVITWSTRGSGLQQPRVVTSQRQGHSGSRKVRAVCRPCNHGWLSTSIEDIAKPILSPLIRSERVSISADMQRILATWAAKTVMTSEHINPKEAAVQQPERTWLMRNLAPPAGWHVWIGSYGGTQWRDLGIFQHPGRLEVPSSSGDTPAAHHNLELTMIGSVNCCSW